MQRPFERASFALFLFLIFWAPWPLGSNRPWAWTILEVGIFASAALWCAGWMMKEFRTPEILKAAWPAFAVLGLWLAWTALYWLPLPKGLIELLSPQAAALHALAAGYPDSRPTLSLDPNASLAFWLKSCAYAITFFLALGLGRKPERVRAIAFALVLSGLVQAVYGGLMHLTGTNLEIFGARISHSGQASGGFVNRNHLAGFLEIALAAGIGLMIAQLEDTPRRSWRRFVRDMAQTLLSSKAPLRLFLVAMVVALVMTRSRMGNSAFFSSLLIAGTVALILSRRATRSTVVLIVSLIVVDIFIVGAWFGVEKTVKRIEETTVQDVEDRIDPSVVALDITRDYPLAGTGPGTFYTAFTRYRVQEIRPYFDFVHNDYVQFLTETGWIGALLIGLLPLMALVQAVLAQSRRRDPLARGMGFAALMGVSAIAMHSSVDFNLQIPANAFVFMILLSFAWTAMHLKN